MKTGIIIPCYNEGQRLNVDAFINFIKANSSYHLCFVNDGSKDNTLEVLHKIKEARTIKVSIIDMKRNRGKAAAVRAGARYLFNRQDVDYIGFIDADLSTDFKDFKNLVNTLQQDSKLSLVYGSRGLGGDNIKKDPLRKFLSSVIRVLVQFILGLPIKDTQCGAKVFRRKMTPILFKETFLSKWLFDVEIFIRLKRYFGSEYIMDRMHEQALSRWVHVDDSKLGLKDSLQIPLALMQIWISYNLLLPGSTYLNAGYNRTVALFQ